MNGICQNCGELWALADNGECGCHIPSKCVQCDRDTWDASGLCDECIKRLPPDDRMDGGEL